MGLDWPKPFFSSLGIYTFYVVVQSHSYSHHRTVRKEKAQVSLQLVTFWDLNIFIRKVVKNALVFCSHPVIYLQSPDCLDPIQLSMGRALRKYLGTGAWTGPWNWSPVSRGCCNRQRGGWECSQSAFAWKVLDGMVSPWTKFHFLSSCNHRRAW